MSFAPFMNLLKVARVTNVNSTLLAEESPGLECRPAGNGDGGSALDGGVNANEPA
jgi:hypothetical protein